MVQIYSIKELISHARAKSPFYQECYQQVPEGTYELEKLPIINRNRFCTASNFNNNTLLTETEYSGTVFKSGGTTGYPKFSIYSTKEWKAFASIFGEKLAGAGLENGDRVANLFYAGDLYAAFIFYRDAMDYCPLSLLQFPIGGFTPIDEVVRVVREYGINVLIGVPTTMLELADVLHRSRETLPVRKILFGGEVMFLDQKDYIREVMPGVKIFSIGYGSVDAGHLGYADNTCGMNEHRVFSGSTIMELLDEETGVAIKEKGRVGKLVYTNLTRTLMPIIRYPVGDRAMWVEDMGKGDRKFMLVGRAEDGARLENLVVGRQEIADVILKYRRRLSISNFQLVTVHEDTRDRLSLHLASIKNMEVLDLESPSIIEDVYKAHPNLKLLVDQNKIHPLKIRWVSVDDLERNPRTGKLYVFCDHRHREVANTNP